MSLHGTDHWWRTCIYQSRKLCHDIHVKANTTEENLGWRARTGEALLDVLLSYIASTTLPASQGVVENIVHFEVVGEHGNEIVKLNPAVSKISSSLMLAQIKLNLDGLPRLKRE
jgi:hypothetical protein